jgi:hypothetical protein
VKRGFNFSIKAVIFIFFLIINQEQKASSIDTGSGLHFMSAISSDPKMQELIIKSFFYTGTLLSCSISALIITALTKYIFFDKNKDKIKKDQKDLLAKIQGIETEYNDKINVFNPKIQDSLKQLATSYQQSLDTINTSHQDLIKTINNNHDDKIKAVNRDIRCFEDQYDKKLLLLRQDHVKTEDALNTKLTSMESTLSQLSKKLTSMESTLTQYSLNSKNEQDRLKLVDAQNTKKFTDIETTITNINQYSKSLDDKIKAEAQTIKTDLEDERDELKKQLDQAKQDHKKEIEELGGKYETFSQNINSKIEEFNSNAETNQHNLEKKFNQGFTTEKQNNQALIEEIKKGYEDRISQLQEGNKEKIAILVDNYDQKIKELSQKQQAALEIHKELLALKQKEETRESEKHEWEKNDREEKITAEKAKKEFLTKNNDGIQTIITKLTDDLQKIDFTNIDSGLKSYKIVKTNFPDWGLENAASRQNTIMVYAMKDTRFNDNIHQGPLNQSTTNSEKEEVKTETPLTPGQCQEYLLSDVQIKSLVEKFIKRFDEMKAFQEQHPEVNELYQNNKTNIKDCLDKIESLITNLDQEKINKQNNEYFEKISKSETIKDLFINAVSTFKIKFENTVDAEGVFPFLSQEDSKKLESALKSITSENEKRGKDSIREYRWFENVSKDLMETAKEEIQKIVKEISSQDYTVYEKYSDLSTYGDACSLVAKNEKINDQNRDIVNILLQKEYDGFKAALAKEKKERDTDPHRCSLYQNNEENIKAYFKSLKKIVESIKQENIANITEDQNKEYAKLRENINFESQYNESTFIDATLSNLRIKLTEIDNLSVVLNKEEKKSIKDYFVALKKEYELRKQNPAREYQWYINSNRDPVGVLQQFIEELTNKIKQNSQDDHSYEIYQDVLDVNLDIENILSQIILNNNNDLDAAKLVDYLKDHLKALQKAFNAEKELRRLEPQRCFIGKKNKDEIIQYNTEFNRFITNLQDEKAITEDTNNKYVNINAFLENKENRGQDFKELFFGYTFKIFGIDYEDANAIEVYNILNFDNQRKIDDFLKNINEERNHRKAHQAREFNWYINDNNLQHSLGAMNSKINAFKEECKKESFQKHFEDIYLEYCKTELDNNNTVSDQSLIRLLAKHSEVDLKNISVDNIKYHVNLAIFKEVAKAEQDRRSSKPERSYYYNDKKEIIGNIFDAIKKYNEVLGDDKKTVSEGVNEFYKYIHGEFIFVEAVLQNKKLFLDKIGQYLDIKDYDQILFLLSASQVEKIDMLYNKIKKETELRKVYASRALSEDNKKKLIQFREKLTQYISELSADSLITNKTAVDVLGSAILAYTGDFLYEELFKVFGIDNGSNVSLFLDESDKNKIQSFQELLKTASQKVKDNQEELEREKRLLKNVFAVSQLHQPDYIIDGITEKEEISNLEAKINEKKDELKKLKNSYEETIKSKQGEIDKITQENSNHFTDMKNKLTLLKDTLKQTPKDFQSAERKKLFFQEYLKFYIKDQEITLSYEVKEEGNTLNLLDAADLNALFRFNLGIKSNNKFKQEGDFWSNISSLGEWHKQQETVVDNKDGFDCNFDDKENKDQLKNIIYLIDLLIDKMNINQVNTDSSILKIVSLYNSLSLSTHCNISPDELHYLIVFIISKKGIINDVQAQVKNITEKTIGTIKKEFGDLYSNYLQQKNSGYYCKKLKRLLSVESIVLFIDKMLKVDDSNFLYKCCDAIKKCKSLYDHIVYSHIRLSKEVEVRGEDNYYQVLRNFIEKKGYDVNSCSSTNKPDLFNKQNTHFALYKFFHDIDKIQSWNQIDYFFGADHYGFDDKWLSNVKHTKERLANKTTKLQSYILKFKFYFDENAETLLTQETARMVELGEKFDEMLVLITQQEQELASEKSQYELKRKVLEGEISELEKEIQSIQEVVSKKESGKMLSQQSLDDIPQRMLVYLFKVQISQYIETILAMKEKELGDILNSCKTSKEKIKNNEKKQDNSQLDNLFLLIKHIQKNNIQGFLEQVICSFERIQDVNTLKDYLITISQTSYNVSSDKGHFLLYGTAGTGKSQFLKVALPHYINKLENQDLKNYLQNNCHMYFIAKGDYNKEATLQGGLGNDIEKMLSVLKKGSASPMVIVVYDECDAFVAERNRDASNSGDDTNALLTLIDKSTKNPFCFAGTTNRDTFDQAAVRGGRLNAVLVPMPNYNNFNVIITRYKEKYENMIKNNVIQKDNKSIFQQCLQNCESMLKIAPEKRKGLLQRNKSGIPYIINAIEKLPHEMQSLI